MKIKRKIFTKYDDTDSLKRMKDSDILAAEKKRKKGVGSAIYEGVKGAGVGAGLGAAAGAAMSGFKGAKRGSKYGALIGAAVSLPTALNKRDKYNNSINFYNDRLEFAQRQAKRRERKDWKQNMTQREGYSY